MTHENFYQVVERTKRVKLVDAIDALEDLYGQISRYEGSVEEYCKLYELCDLIFQQSVFLGTEDDYHNAAVVCARGNDYDIACQFLDLGLRRYPYNIDLLADYLKYGMQCGKAEECQEKYNKLILKKDNWNWRAYQFSIDYLMSMMDIDLLDREHEILNLIREYKEKLPEDEGSYLAEVEFMEKKNRKNGLWQEQEPEFIRILNDVIYNNHIVKRTARCDLKLAQYYYDSGQNIEKAMELLERCKVNSIEMQVSVNRSYVYLLLALCKMTQYYKKKNIENQEDLVQEVYKNYHIAAGGKGDSRIVTSKELIEAFVRETEVAYPYYDDIDG